MGNPNLYDYFNYREYLSDFYTYNKENKKGFSHRSFLSDAGISGAVYLQRILRGERKLMPRYIPNFCKALGLKTAECKYFGELVLFGNEKKVGQKEAHLKNLLELRYALKEYRLKDKGLQFFESWYIPVLREMAPLKKFGEDYSLIAASLLPKITPAQAKKGIQFLLENGYLEINSKGNYRQTQRILTTGNETDSVTLIKYHKKNLDILQDVFDLTEKEERDMSSLTLSVSGETYKKIKSEIQSFRKKILGMAEADKKADRVCHVGFQLVPRSRKPGKGGRP